MSGSSNFFDFNTAVPPTAASHYDLKEITERLKERASEWVPAAFPMGRIDNGVLRLADISGRAPKKQGSCIITLKGEHAGCYFDHGTGVGGGPLETLSYACGLTGRALFEKAAELTFMKPDAAKPALKQTNGNGEESRKRQVEKEIEQILARCVPITGTIVEAWFQSRQLVMPDCTDLLFNADITHWKTKTSYPAMIARVRGQSGDFNGCIHRTYLSEGGLKPAIEHNRLTLGEPDGGAVRLYPIINDLVGIAEGIETAVAASLLNGVPVWSVLSTSGMINFKVPSGVKRVIVFSDAGKGGETAARKLASRLMTENIEVEVRLPEFGDDFNDDLIKKFRGDVGVSLDMTPPQNAPEISLSPQQPQQSQQQRRPWQPTSDSDLTSPTEQILEKIRKLPDQTSMEVARTVIADMAIHSWDALMLGVAMNELKRATGLPVKSLSQELKLYQRAFGPKENKSKIPAWKHLIACNANGDPKNIMLNAVKILENDDQWQNVLAFDEFAFIVKLVAAPPWWDDTNIRKSGNIGSFRPHNLQDEDIRSTTVWIQNLGVHVAAPLIRDALYYVAHKNKYHPVRDYLDTLEWDGTKRLHNWLTYYIGAEHGSSALERDIKEYFAKIGTAWIVSMIARVRDPGCKADCILILEGQQGIKKSTVFSVIGGDWFSDDMHDFGREGQMQMQGKWVIELSDLDAYRRSQMTQINAFISRTSDNFRTPYGYTPQDHPRQAILGATTNEIEWLKDETGGRRWWPVKCGDIDIESLKRDRDQLLAEADVLYGEGYKWWIDDDEIAKTAREEQGARQSDDAWFGPISRYLQGTMLNDISVGDVLSNALSIELGKWNKFDQSRVGKIIVKCGWERYRSNEVGRPYKYRKVVKREEKEE